MDDPFFNEANARAESLGMKWSEYVRRCIERDLRDGGDLVLKPKSNR